MKRSSLLLAALVLAAAIGSGRAEPTDRKFLLRAFGVPTGEVQGVYGEADLRIMDAFLKRHTNVTLRSATGIDIPGRNMMDTKPLMQIAGEVSPDVMYVNFRQSDTYIRNKFLYPLDLYVEREAGMAIPDGHLLSSDEYFARIQTAPNYESNLKERLPRPIWDVIRRDCPYGAKCPYLKEWGREGAEHHVHVWAIPFVQYIMALFYNKEVFAAAGLPDRVPETCEELFDWARRTTNPKENVYGMSISVSDPGWQTLSFLYSFNGRVVKQDEEYRWRCCFDEDAAVDAYTFVARLFLEPFTNEHGRIASCVDTGETYTAGQKSAMWFSYLDQSAFAQIDPNQIGFGPVPKGPTGIRGSEYNCGMLAIYAGSGDKDPELRDIAWDYLWFRGGNEAEIIRTKTYVENGLGRFVRPTLLRASGFDDLVDSVPPGWEEANAAALQGGVPEPYGKNCQLVYQYVSRAIDQFRNDKGVQEDIANGDIPAARAKIAKILKDRVAMADEKMIGHVPPEKMRVRRIVAAFVVVFIIASFAFVFRRVMKTFAAAIPRSAASKNSIRRGSSHDLAWLLLLPGILTIAVWSYWPLARGTVMAFQDYNVRGFSEWIGLDNFAAVLFSPEFWHSLGISLKYTILHIIFGFCAPIILALLLSEVPRGKVLFRTIYYLPAVLSGVVVMFLWKGFYGPYGMINQVCNAVLHAVNFLFGTSYPDLVKNWLWEPSMALFFCLLPSIWAGMGPGCLIYLAALKTVPDDLYEAADIEGAGVLSKIRHIAIPSIKALVMINFIGSVIGCMKSGSSFILAMTGGGPYVPYGATELVGLHIFWEAFGYLRFGSATAMAWVLGSMLIGFTVFQLQRLSKMEFRASGSAKKTE